jgi:UrcA family protein
MYTRFSSRIVMAVVIAGSLLGGVANAGNDIVIVSKGVTTRGLDLNSPTDAQALYARLRHAANDVCTRSARVDVLSPDNSPACFEKALGKAVRQANSPLVTQAYLFNHTLRDAATWGIEVPSEVAKR